MRTCENCKWFGKITGYGVTQDTFSCNKKEFAEQDLIFVEDIVCNYYERKNMNIKDCYNFMQAEWVKLYNVEVDDTVKVLCCGKDMELGFQSFFTPTMFTLIGSTAKITFIHTNGIGLSFSEDTYFCFPFFCLEFVKKAEPKIEITCKINNKDVPLSTLSKETLLNIREKT